MTEWKITLGIWALGGLVLTAAIKVSLPVLSGRLKVGMAQPIPSSLPPPPDESEPAHAQSH